MNYNIDLYIESTIVISGKIVDLENKKYQGYDEKSSQRTIAVSERFYKCGYRKIRFGIIRAFDSVELINELCRNEIFNDLIRRKEKYKYYIKSENDSGDKICYLEFDERDVLFSEDFDVLKAMVDAGLGRAVSLDGSEIHSRILAQVDGDYLILKYAEPAVGYKVVLEAMEEDENIPAEDYQRAKEFYGSVTEHFTVSQMLMTDTLEEVVYEHLSREEFARKDAAQYGENKFTRAIPSRVSPEMRRQILSQRAGVAPEVISAQDALIAARKITVSGTDVLIRTVYDERVLEALRKRDIAVKKLIKEGKLRSAKEQ